MAIVGPAGAVFHSAKGGHGLIESTLGRLAAGEDLSADETAQAVAAIMQGKCTEGEIGLLLTGLRLKGETANELLGAARAMRQAMTPIRSRRTGLVDTCGTGGDGCGTFNISTAAALVAAAAGVPVAKHGNRRASGRTGSADVLAALGVNIDADLQTVEACLDELGLCFCFAPLFHASMKHVAAVRQKLGVPTIFNLLGPLANPAGAQFQVVGVARAEVQHLLADALLRLGTQRALVVRGEDGLDEITLSGPTRLVEAAEGRCRELVWEPAHFGLSEAPLDALRADSPQESAHIIRSVLDGQRGPARDITVLNAAAALWVSRAAATPQQAAEAAAAAIDSGKAAHLLHSLAQRTQQARSGR
jgi:anthranilate phosphoribosyltransferase